MFSHQPSACAQLRQWERGVAMLSPSGMRVSSTLRKLPKARPSSAAKMALTSWISLRIWNQAPLLMVQTMATATAFMGFV